jgi:tRNA(fMet)-specific endonuclease VapC
VPLFILDTDHVSLFQRSHPRVVAHALAVPPQSLAVTVVTVEEQMRGWLNAIRRASSMTELTGKSVSARWICGLQPSP